MTGDGENDALALATEGATDAAPSAAAIVLTRLSVIVEAVDLSRAIFFSFVNPGTATYHADRIP